MIRKASKKGIDIRQSELNDEFANGIADIYNESPVRQGKKFSHFGKNIETVRRDNSSFMERSQFVGAFLDGELIGFCKLVHGAKASNLMQIISKIEHRDKAPTNALIAKAVEFCANRGTGFLHYGMWSRRGLGAFKSRHGFERFEVPRYFVPLTRFGRFSLRVGLHQPLSKHLPESLIDKLTDLRARWYAFRYGEESLRGS